MNMNISRDAILFFMVEVHNEGGVQPATLGSAYDSYRQADRGVLLDWCGYMRGYTEASRFCEELGIELRRLIRKYGRGINLERFFGRSHKPVRHI